MPPEETIRFFSTREEADLHAEPAMVVPCLDAMSRVSHVVGELEHLALRSEQIPIWRPVRAWVQLAQLRADLAEATGSYEAALKQNFDRLGEPVERGSSMDNAWLQSYSTALGTAAALQLLSSYRTARLRTAWPFFPFTSRCCRCCCPCSLGCPRSTR